MQFQPSTFKINFLLARLVIFVLLVLFNFLTIGFAAWSIASAESNDSPIGAFFPIFNSLITLASISGAILAFYLPKLSTAHVKHELVWSIATSNLNLVAMLLASFLRPSSFGVSDCSRFIPYVLLLAVGWSATVLLVGYAAALGAAAFVHDSIYPNLMTSSVHSVPWFQKVDIENKQVRVSMFFPPDLDTKFACQSPSWEGRFAGIRMHNGPFAVVTAKKAAEEEAAKAKAAQDSSSQSNPSS